MPSSRTPTLAQRLKQQLESNKPSAEVDPENAYSSLNTFTGGSDRAGASADEVDHSRDHYTAVGRSRLRDTQREQLDALADKYLQPSSKTNNKRVKIFDDDLSEEEEEEEEIGAGGNEDSEQSDEDDSEEDEDDDEDEDEEDEAESDGGSSEEDGEDDQTSFKPRLAGEMGVSSAKSTASASTSKPLDPISAIKDSKNKDVEKGKAIRRQQRLFDDLLTSRITFQKAWSCSNQLPSSLAPGAEASASRKRSLSEMHDDDRSVERAARHRLLGQLKELSDSLFSIRKTLVLPGIELPSSRSASATSSSATSSRSWLDAAYDSLALADSNHKSLLSTLRKWSTKIQAAAQQQQATANGGRMANKFSAAGQDLQVGAVEAIEAALAAQLATASSSPSALHSTEDILYRSLLREVIETRSSQSGSGPAVDLSQLRSEKKKRRDAERGASKGRKIRYTVHEKAQNFVVPIPFAEGWHDEQIDELFSSLLGGAGMEGAGAGAGANRAEADRVVLGAAANAAEQEVSGGGQAQQPVGGISVAGLRVF